MKKITETRMFLLVLLAFLYGVSGPLMAQSVEALPGPVSLLTVLPDGTVGCNLHAHDDVAHAHHDVFAEMQSSGASLTAAQTITSNNAKSKAGGGANIVVSYFLADPSFAPRVQAAIASFQSAVNTWAGLLDSDVTIRVAAVFQPLGLNVLGSAGTTIIYRDIPGLEANTWYGNALADKLTGVDLTPGQFDIICRFSTVFPNWYFGTDGNTPASDFDFKSVVLHELGHGLGFFGSMRVNNTTGVGSYGFGATPAFPSIYDRLHASPDNKSILKDERYPNFSTELGSMLLSGALNAKGPRIKQATNGKGAEIFTILDSELLGREIPGLTDLWLQGSSYSHLDFLTYSGTPNGLMVPFLSRGRSFASPGEITLAIFDDIGWNGKVNNEVGAEERIAASALNTKSAAFGVYPNPIANSFSVSLGEKHSPLVGASLIDALGRQIGLEVPNAQQAEIHFDLSQKNIPAGLYILKLQFENQEISSIKLLKE